MTDIEEWNHYAAVCPQYTLIYTSLTSGPIEGVSW